MATLVFSTIGTVLGGPVGGAIGALLGQSIDAQILGPGSRGPKLGDLTVQTSSYGTQIPKIFGRMRVAGSVIWSTDLVQSEETSGAKGQPGVTYSYAVSFAVALSARRVASIGRIWADGKLLRGAEGDFKVPTQFRFYDGSEDQAADPLIASIEGIDQTPAYRGLALAVFEGLELAEYGNRIPFLTFEVVADDEPPGIGGILDECSSGAIAVSTDSTVEGYAAYGASVRAAVEPLIETFAVRLFDDGALLRAPAVAIPVIDEHQLGNGLDGEREPRITRELVPDTGLPAVLRFGFYDPDRDYQAGEARALVGDRLGKEARSELAAVLTADRAKGLAQQLLARDWARRDRLTVNLSPEWLALEPGAVLQLPVAPAEWSIARVTIEGFVPRVELTPFVNIAPTLVAADPGTVVPSPDIVESATVLALVDAPNLDDPSADEPVLLLAASTASPGWSAKTVEIRRGTVISLVTTARRKSVIGTALGVLGASGPCLLDTRNSLDVALVDSQHWLTSCDEDALANGANLALVGQELLQFGSAEPLGSGTFRLSRLLRGRFGSEHHAAAHIGGERFVLIERDALVPVRVPAFAIGATIAAEARTGDAIQTVVSTASIRPPSPVALAAEADGFGGLAVRWTRRSRKGWHWIDEVDAPLGEAQERYRIAIASATGAIDREVGEPRVDLSAADLGPLGPAPWTIAVRQLGELAASIPATLLYPNS